MRKRTLPLKARRNRWFNLWQGQQNACLTFSQFHKAMLRLEQQFIKPFMGQEAASKPMSTPMSKPVTWRPL